MTPATFEIEAQAKINVVLRVTGRRADGYHDIESLVVPVSLSDGLTFQLFGRRGVVVLRIDPPVHGVPQGRDNIVTAAARAVAARCPLALGAIVTLRKRIPVAAGLGGGSADAAAAMLGLDRLWRCGLIPEELEEAAAEVGSDVPALLHGRPVLVRGRGELVEPVTVAPLWWVVLPLGFAVRAAEAYAWWDEDGALTGDDPGQVLEAAAAGDPELLAATMFNDLQAPVERRHGEVAEARRRLTGAGCLGAVMAGSGPTVVGLARDEADARAIARRVPGAIAVSGPG
jgi:4-diphosphocytidyl-2-C-methyl-D-erythritol kinase